MGSRAEDMRIVALGDSEFFLGVLALTHTALLPLGMPGSRPRSHVFFFLLFVPAGLGFRKAYDEETRGPVRYGPQGPEYILVCTSAHMTSIPRGKIQRPCFLHLGSPHPPP